MKMKLSDYLFKFVADWGVRHVFMLPGGGAMHLNNSAGKTEGITLISNHHEQASAMAAETYARITENLGVALVTTGPGGTNAVTGVAGAWLDSTPCLFISGQVKRADLIGELGIRQNGVQEIDIVSIVKSITKYAVTVMEPETIRYHLEKAVYLAKSGRPGPVWIDVPLDVQAAMIDVDVLNGFEPEVTLSLDEKKLREKVADVIKLLNESERPILFLGNGVRLAGAAGKVEELVQKLNIPVLFTWPAMDILPDSHDLVVGRPGPVAPRGANFALQNSDFLLSIGARLDNVVTGYSHENFARAAKKVMVDIDQNELNKMRTKIDVSICVDAKAFIDELLKQSGSVVPKDRPDWMSRCSKWKTKYPVVLPEYRKERRVSTYVLAEVLSEELQENEIAISGSSGAGIEIFLLTFKPKRGQRVFCTTALGAMGNGLPAAIGACLAGGGKRTVCVNGDGCLQLNIQEFQTLKRLQLPVKLFVLNNDGYSSMRTSQSRYFGRLTGADSTSGLTLPDICKVASSYGLTVRQIKDQSNLREEVREVLELPGPAICDVWCQVDEPRAPSMMSRQTKDGSMVSMPLEDLWPFLDRKEFLSNMLIPPLKECLSECMSS